MLLPPLLSLLLSVSPHPAPPTVVPDDQAALIAEAMGLPAGTRFEYEHVVEDGGSREKLSTSEGVGAGAEASGQTLSESLDGSPPTASAGDSSALGGGITRDIKARGFAPTVLASNPFFWAGLIALGVCGWFAYKRQVKRAVIAGVAAIGCFLMVTNPLIGLFAIAGVLVLSFGGDFLAYRKEVALATEKQVAAYEAARNREALRAVAAGIEDPALAPDARAAVKDRIGIHADETDRETIRAVKVADRLG